MTTPGQATIDPGLPAEHLTGPAWFTAFGVFMLALGCLATANLVFSTTFSATYIGLLMIVAGSLHATHAFTFQAWQPRLLWLIAGLFYLLAGSSIALDPRLIAALLTLVLAVSLMMAGSARVVFALAMRSSHRSMPIAATGAVPAFLGLMLLIGWPRDGVWLLGAILAADLTTQGIAYVVFGLAIRRNVDPALFDL